MSPVRILERGQIAKYNTTKLTYKAENLAHIPEASIDLITIFIGLHHAPKEDLDTFFSSCVGKLRQ